MFYFCTWVRCTELDPIDELDSDMKINDKHNFGVRCTELDPHESDLDESDSIDVEHLAEWIEDKIAKQNL